jgi:hypothetical protein
MMAAASLWIENSRIGAVEIHDDGFRLVRPGLPWGVAGQEVLRHLGEGVLGRFGPEGCRSRVRAGSLVSAVPLGVARWRDRKARPAHLSVRAGRRLK